MRKVADGEFMNKLILHHVLSLFNARWNIELYTVPAFTIQYVSLMDSQFPVQKITSWVHCKKRLAIFHPHPAGMSLTKLSLAGINLIISGQGEFD